MKRAFDADNYLEVDYLNTAYNIPLIYSDDMLMRAIVAKYTSDTIIEKIVRMYPHLITAELITVAVSMHDDYLNSILFAVV